jgi:exopolyphosphatase/guanosine-5'-triphosphate,3'-diphosphate pyrophosphatase
VGAVGDVLTAAGWPTGSVSRDGLDWLQDRLISAQSAERIRLVGLKDDRRTIIGGGLSILCALFDLLQIDDMQLAMGGLRHGVLFKLIGNTSDQTDIRDKSVHRLATKFGTDSVHGLRVSKVALHLFAQLQSRARAAVMKNERPARKLSWAAQLHEIGSQISHSDYHKHGAYILGNSDAMGFSLSELHRLSQLVLGHRGKLRKLEVDFEDEEFIQQLLALRLAVILCHARRDPDLSGLQLTCSAAKNKTFAIGCLARWTQTYPQSAHLLGEEVLAWQKTPWTLFLGKG